MKPKRIISLLPACTELVYAFGLADCLVGRSHECDFPAPVKDLPACTRSRINTEARSGEIDRQVGSRLAQALSLYEIDLEKIRVLGPDVVLTQAHCEVCAVSLADVENVLRKLTGINPKVISYSPNNLAEVWTEMLRVAEALDVPADGKSAVKEWKSRVVYLIEKTCLIKNRPTVACIEWLDPLMISGNWVPDLVGLSGGQNVLSESGKQSPRIDWQALLDLNPDFIYVMPCGFSIDRIQAELDVLTSRPEWKKLQAVRTHRVFLIDGNQYFNRPGPRLIESAEALAETLHPDLFSFGHSGKAWIRLD